MYCAENSNSCCTAFPHCQESRCRLREALRCDMVRGDPKQRSQNRPRNSQRVVFVPIFGRFRPDFNIRAQDRVECRCRRRGTPPRRDADCASQWRLSRPGACATPSFSKWVDIWRIDGLLARKLSEMDVLCGKLQFLLHRFSSLSGKPLPPSGGAQMRHGEGGSKTTFSKSSPKLAKGSFCPHFRPFSA
jgi:hypothetical protein